MTLATQLTFSRLCTAPLVFILYWFARSHPGQENAIVITSILLLIATYGEISDAIDGSVARKRNEVTDFGKLFDPFSDSVYRFTYFFCFWWMDLCPAWMVVVIFYRETAISFLRLLLRGENVVLAARRSGKIKAIVQAVAIFLILFAQLAGAIWKDVPMQPFTAWVMGGVVLVTVASMIDYLRSHWTILAKIKK